MKTRNGIEIDVGWRLVAVVMVVALVVGLAGCGVRLPAEEPVARSYQTAWYVTSGGDKAVVASGGELEVQSGGTIDIQDGATVTFDGGMDLNGAALTIDADGDTTLQAATDDIPVLAIGAGTGYLNITTGGLKVGNGTPTTMDGEDAYIEGVLEVDGAVNFDSTLDVAGNVIVDGAADAVQLTVQGNGTQTSNTFVVETSGGTDLFWVDNNGDVEINGTTPVLTIGDAGEEDAAVVFDGAAQDFYAGLYDTDDDLQIGLGSALGTTPIIVLDENQNVGLGAASAAAKLDVTGNQMIDGDTDEVQLTVQGNGTQTSNTFVVEASDGTDLFWVDNNGDVEMNGTTPVLTIGDAGEEDAAVVFDGAAQDFYAGIYDTDDDLQIGLGAALGTTPIIVLDENQDVGLGGASAGAKLDVTGNAMVDGGADEEQLVVQGHSSQTNNPFVVEQSDGTDKFTVSNDGNTVIAGTLDAQGNVSDSGGTFTVADNMIIDGAADAVQLTVQGNATQTSNTFVVEISDGTDLFWVDNNGDVEMNGTTPRLTIGDAGEEDTAVVFDGAAQDFYAGIYDTDDDLQIGLGAALGTTPIIVLDENQNVGLGAASAAAKLDVTGNVMIDGDTDEVQLTVQGHSTQGSGLLVLEGSDGTDIVIFSEPPAAAGSGDLVDLTDTFVVQDGTDHLIGVDVNLTGADHTGADNSLTGIDLDLTTEDAQCTEVAIDVSDTSWDIAIDAADVPIVSTAAEWMEDFWGDTIHGELVNVEGTDPQVVALALAQEQYGVATITSGDDNSGGCAASCGGMSIGLHWSADQGGLVFETRLHLDTDITNTVICAGLADTLALEMPATISGASYTTNSSDGAFFCYDTEATVEEWHAIAVDTNVDATGIGATGVAPVADTYQVLRIEVDAAGADAKFYINGSLVKTLTASVMTPATLLSPVVMIDTNEDAVKTVDIDYVYVTARRG